MNDAHLDQNKPPSPIFQTLRILNVVERAYLVVITQCAVCHFFVKATKSISHWVYPLSNAGISDDRSS
jgi:hypothetical protein